MELHLFRNIISICIMSISLYSCYYSTEQEQKNKEVYVSDLKIIHSGDINHGIGLDKPYWMDKLIICGKNYLKGVVVHPKGGGRIAFVEFLLPQNGGRLLGLAGCAEETGGKYNHKMRFRFFIDGELLYQSEIDGNECRELDLDLNEGRVLRIESDDGFDGNYYDHMAFGDLRILY